MKLHASCLGLAYLGRSQVSEDPIGIGHLQMGPLNGTITYNGTTLAGSNILILSELSVFRNSNNHHE
jgi:hypothetical protein